ncbi:MAG: hypothetical protein U5O39_14570 [Gammaproteobacteria bacterium]|nr:hypothetical protein [Gammaproteobacteria bacterium]
MQSSLPTRAGVSESLAQGEVRDLAKTFSDHWGGRFDPIDSAELARARELFNRLLTNIDDPDIGGHLEALGLSSCRFTTPNGPVRVVHEREHDRRGRGVFAFRGESASLAILQAPHTRNDLGTGLITGAWMAHLDMRAAAWNTVSRRGGAGADLARARQSYFTALTDAAIDTLLVPLVIQVHGYAPERRATRAGRDSRVIVSSGRLRSNRCTRQITRRLSRHIAPVRLFPRDIEELGATQNPVGSLLHQRERGEFVHIELARELREHLRQEHTLSLELGRCLL